MVGVDSAFRLPDEFRRGERSTVTRVVSDLVRPNGLVGSPDGRTLYIADWGASRVCRSGVNPDGTLANKKAFASDTPKLASARENPVSPRW